MVTKEEILTVYNQQNNTEYATVQDLGTALADQVLNNPWIEHKKREAYLQAEQDIQNL